MTAETDLVEAERLAEFAKNSRHLTAYFMRDTLGKGKNIEIISLGLSITPEFKVIPTPIEQPVQVHPRPETIVVPGILGGLRKLLGRG